MVPVPVWVAPPGDAVIVQVPAAGKPLNATLPVVTAQVGSVVAPTIGAVSDDGAGLTVTAVAAEIQPDAFLTVTLYGPGATPVNTPVVLV